MAEDLLRLYGPATISGSAASPTTLFTVPARQTYIVRSLSGTVTPVGGYKGRVAPTFLLGKTDLSQANLVGALSVPTTSGIRSGVKNTSIPFTEGEVCVAAMVGSGAPSVAQSTSWGTTWSAASTTDATTLSATYSSIGGNQIWLNVNPTHVYFFMVNLKAASPDTITSIEVAQAGQNSPPTNVVEIGTAASSTVRCSLWGGTQKELHAQTTAWTTTFGGTWTAAFGNFLYLPGGAFIGDANISTSNIVVGTANATGTTATVQTVTTTPQAGGTYQLLLAATDGVNGTYTGPAGSVELMDGGQAALPACTAAAYLVDPPQTNPSVTVSGAGTSFCVLCVELYKGGAPGQLTVTGVRIQ